MKSFKQYITEGYEFNPFNIPKPSSPQPPYQRVPNDEDDPVFHPSDWHIDPADDEPPLETEPPRPFYKDELEFVEDGGVEFTIKQWIIDNLPWPFNSQDIIDLILNGDIAQLLMLLNSGQLPSWVVDRLRGLLQKLLDGKDLKPPYNDLENLPYVNWHLQQLLQRLLDLLNA